MRVLIFGASGMVGQGVLRECVQAADVIEIATIGRTSAASVHEKMRHIVREDLYDYSTLGAELAAFDACFFCLGTPSAGKSEQEYRHVTFDLTIAAATALASVSPSMTFVYVSGAGADSSGRGSVMWARVRGQTENALMALPFKAVYVFRPGVIQPLHGVQSKTRLYRVLYSVTRPLLPLVRALFPAYVLTTVLIGTAMLNAVRRGAPKRVLEAPDIYRLAQPV